MKFYSPIQGWARLAQYSRFKALFDCGLLYDPISQQIYADMKGWGINGST